MGDPGVLRARGQGHACDVAGGGFGIFRGIQRGCALRRFSVGSPGISLPRFPALPCFASRHIHAAPFGAFLCVGSSRRRGVAGFRGVFGGYGALLARGQGSAGGAAGEWAGATAGERAMARGRGWVWDFLGNSTRLRLAAFLCCAFRHNPTPPFGASLPFGPGKVARGGGAGRRGFGVSLGVRALRVLGHGNAWGAAGEWAGPTAWDGFGIFRGI